MAAKTFTKATSIIPKNEKFGRPVYTGGSRVRMIGIPTNQDGSVALNGTALSFKGAINGSDWFTVNGPDGKPVQVNTRVVQGVITPPSYLSTAPAMVPVEHQEWFEGIQVIVPISNQIELEDRSIDIYHEVSNL